MPIQKNNTYYEEDNEKVYYYDENGIQKEVPASAFGDLDNRKLDVSAFSTVSGTFYTNNNQSGFITKTVDNLENYYTKNETYTKTEVDEKISSIGTFVISTLKDGVPDVQDPSKKVIYLTKKEGSTATDPYIEWIYTNDNTWEIIGETTVDLSDYYTKSQTSAASDLSIEFEKYIQIATTSSWDIIEYSGINGIDITNHEVGLSSDYKLAVESVSSKLDTSAFSDVSGTFVTTSTIFSGSSPGLVPSATLVDTDKVLRGDGTWGEAGSTASVSYDAVNEELHIDFSNGGN